MFNLGNFRGPNSLWKFPCLWNPLVVSGSNGRGGQWVQYTKNYYSRVNNGPLRWEGRTTGVEWEWNTIGNINNGIAFTVGGLETSIGNALSRTLRYQSSVSMIKAPKVGIKIPGGTVHVGVKAVRTASSVLKTAGWITGAAGLGITFYEIRTQQKNILGEGGLDLLMGLVGFVPGWGWAASGLYFGSKAALEATGNDFWNY